MRIRGIPGQVVTIGLIAVGLLSPDAPMPSPANVVVHTVHMQHPKIGEL